MTFWNIETFEPFFYDFQAFLLLDHKNLDQVDNLQVYISKEMENADALSKVLILSDKQQRILRRVHYKLIKYAKEVPWFLNWIFNVFDLCFEVLQNHQLYKNFLVTFNPSEAGAEVA